MICEFFPLPDNRFLVYDLAFHWPWVDFSRFLPEDGFEWRYGTISNGLLDSKTLILVMDVDPEVVAPIPEMATHLVLKFPNKEPENA